ncbi:MAG: radical SAM protein [Deltaproteobacteria bacterium]|nr:radical SAM protein [Deltaproteobacteria bacterium]
MSERWPSPHRYLVRETMLGRFEKIRRNFKDIDYLRALARTIDDKPLQCSLYVTDRCNLECGYCTEYNNDASHPHIDDLKTWARKIRELGTVKIALVGGEPLTHPDIIELVRFCKSLGMSTSLTTNGFLLTDELVRSLERAGLDVIQVSVDRVTPSEVTKKSLKSLERKLELFKSSPIKLHITGVICADTLDECEQVLEYGLSRDIPTEIRLVHAGPPGFRPVDFGEQSRVRAILQRMIARKRRGEKVHTTQALLDYQMETLEGKPVHEKWTCAAGYKLFFVSAKGRFMECSMRPAGRSIMEMTRNELRSYYRKKPCQQGCGVYCAIGASLFRDNPVSYVAGEVVPRLRQSLNDIKNSKKTAIGRRL